MAERVVSDTLLASETSAGGGGGGGGGGGVDSRFSMDGPSDAGSGGAVDTFLRCSSATFTSSRLSNRCFSSALCVEAIVARIKLVASWEMGKRKM